MQWMILQQEKPDDFVIANGKELTVRKFVEKSLENFGISIKWQGKGINECGIISEINTNEDLKIKVNDTIIRVSEKYFRPAEVDYLLGDASKAHKKLGWKPKISIDDLIKEMIENDFNEAKKEQLIKNSNL